MLGGLAALAAPSVAAAVVLVDGTANGTVDGALLAAVVLAPFALVEVLVPLLPRGEQQPSIEVAATRLRAVLDAPDPVVDPEDPLAVPAHPSVVLDAVSLRWPNTTDPVLRGLALHLDPGSRARDHRAQRHRQVDLAAAMVRFIGVDGGATSSMRSTQRTPRATTSVPW